MPINGTPVRWNYDGNFSCTFTPPTDNYTRIFSGILTNSRTYILPDKSGTFAMTSDVPTGINGGIQLLGKLAVADLNTAADQIITLSGGTKFVIVDVLFTNASNTPSLVQNANIYSAINKGGTLIASTGAAGASNLTTPTHFIDWLTQANIVIMYNGDPTSQVTVGNTVYLNVGTKQGGTCTCSVYIYGYILA